MRVCVCIVKMLSEQWPTVCLFALLILPSANNQSVCQKVLEQCTHSDTNESLNCCGS